MAEAARGSTSGFVGGLFVGVAMGCIMSGIVLGAGGYAMFKRSTERARAGWNLVPVVVAAENIPAGTIVTFDMVSQRAFPEQFVTSSVVKPESANNIVNQRALVPIQRGDPFRWSDFEGTGPKRELPKKTDPNGK